jgi:hypothetical protein
MNSRQWVYLQSGSRAVLLQCLAVKLDNVKRKVVPVRNELSSTRWICGGEWRYSSTIFDVGTRYKWVVSFAAWPLYPWGNSCRYLFDGRLGGPQSRSGSCGVKKTFAPAGNQTLAFQPVAIQAVRRETSMLWNFAVWLVTGIGSMELSPSWEANSCSATREIPSILWNLTVHHLHKNTPLILCWARWIESTPLSYFSKIHLILSSYPHLGLPSDLFPSGLPEV